MINNALNEYSGFDYDYFNFFKYYNNYQNSLGALCSQTLENNFDYKETINKITSSENCKNKRNFQTEYITTIKIVIDKKVVNG